MSFFDVHAGLRPLLSRSLNRKRAAAQPVTLNPNPRAKNLMTANHAKYANGLDFSRGSCLPIMGKGSFRGHRPPLQFGIGISAFYVIFAVKSPRGGIVRGVGFKVDRGTDEIKPVEDSTD
jgi:hypothetical protein